MSNNTLILGLQWGDEGKGKIVDNLSESFDVVCRFQGGHNAGHTIKVDGEQIIKLVKQIEKQIEVIAAFYHTDEETIYLETALYKVNSKSLFEERQIQNIIKKSRANIVTVKPEYFVIEKTGWREETEDLYHKLKKYGLLQFVRSGRISVSKSSMEISKHLKNNENE